MKDRKDREALKIEIKEMIISMSLSSRTFRLKTLRMTPRFLSRAWVSIPSMLWSSLWRLTGTTRSKSIRKKKAERSFAA